MIRQGQVRFEPIVCSLPAENGQRNLAVIADDCPSSILHVSLRPISPEFPAAALMLHCPLISDLPLDSH
jgi:hypothetical protein